MTELETFAQRFWSRVWQCEHRHPCKTCCWPWRGIDVTVNWKVTWQAHGTFCGRATHRLAYELHQQTIVFATRAFIICHQCHFGPCCNFTHLRPGSISDNVCDPANQWRNRRPISLPDGQVWSFQAACHAQNAFFEARFRQRVFAGPVHPKFERFVHDVDMARFSYDYGSVVGR